MACRKIMGYFLHPAFEFWHYIMILIIVTLVTFSEEFLPQPAEYLVSYVTNVVVVCMALTFTGFAAYIWPYIYAVGAS